MLQVAEKAGEELENAKLVLKVHFTRENVGGTKLMGHQATVGVRFGGTRSIEHLVVVGVTLLRFKKVEQS